MQRKSLLIKEVMTLHLPDPVLFDLFDLFDASPSFLGLDYAMKGLVLLVTLSH